MNFDELRVRWNAEIKRWAAGSDEPTDPLFVRWRRTYVGRGDGVVDLAAMPEPWIGDPTRAPGLVLMGLNPGPVTPKFQHRGGNFPKDIATTFHGSWSSWAASMPYVVGDWPNKVRPNKYWITANTFVKSWVGGAVPGESVVGFELYPWHSEKWVPSAFEPCDDILHEAIIEPIQSVGATWAIGKGKPWWEALERLAKRPGWRRLGGIGGQGQSQCPSAITHRKWLVVRAPTGLFVVAMKMKSMPMWPKGEVVAKVRSELEQIASSC